MDARISTSLQDFHTAPPSHGFAARLARVTIALAIIAAGLACTSAFASSTQDEDGALIPATAMRGGERTYNGALTSDGDYHVTTRFRSFTGEPLTVGFVLPRNASSASVREFGIDDDELDAMRDACIASRCEQDALDRQTTRYYETHALRLRTVRGQPAHLFVDVAQVVRRNRTRVQPVAEALRELAAARGADRQWTIDAAVALVQTGLLYRQPSQIEDGRQILGFFPPPRALERGYGDCDTKAALLAAILQNLTDAPIIGVHVPRHYLLGIAATPRADQASMKFAGKRFVLVEASGPGERRPGDIAKATQLALDRDDGVRVDPMF